MSLWKKTLMLSFKNDLSYIHEPCITLFARLQPHFYSTLSCLIRITCQAYLLISIWNGYIYLCRRHYDGLIRSHYLQLYGRYYWNRWFSSEKANYWSGAGGIEPRHLDGKPSALPLS